MPYLTEDGRRAVDEIARHTGFSPDAVTAMLDAMLAGGGTMAQFSHPELGGMGQWSRGGMLMIGDMFNSGLKGRVDQLANALSDAMQRGPALVATNGGGFASQDQSRMGQSAMQQSAIGQFGGQGWWPSDLGSPASSGAQNDMRYAIFPGARRLAVLQGGQVTVYDTRDHSLYGVSQQQGGSQSLSFNSQYGTVRLEDLRSVSGATAGGHAPSGPAPTGPAPEPPRDFQPQPPAFGQPAAGQAGGSTGGQDVIGLLERLATLHQNGVLTAEEFAAKKAELLGRL